MAMPINTIVKKSLINIFSSLLKFVFFDLNFLKFLFIASFFSLFCFQNLSKSSFSLNFPFFVNELASLKRWAAKEKNEAEKWFVTRLPRALASRPPRAFTSCPAPFFPSELESSHTACWLCSAPPAPANERNRAPPKTKCAPNYHRAAYFFKNFFF